MFCGKKLLVLGGAFQHCKVVETAKNMGITVYVTDYLKESPAKKIADVSLEYDVKDITGIVNFCKTENIDGVINTSLDPCQIPYQQICERLSIPCFGNQEQFFQLTNKCAFKKICKKYDVDTIMSYSEEDIENNSRKIQFPIVIKPEDSRGSRGQNVCFDLNSARKAIKIASQESSTGKVIIEKYMENAQDFAVAYILVNGKAHLIRTCDRYVGSVEEKLEKVAIAASSPSKITEMYMQNVNSKVAAMLEGMGLKNGPVFMQGIIDKETVRFYDPGLRFSGGEYERLFKMATGIDLIEMMIAFAITGDMKPDYIPKNSFWLNGKRIFHLDPTLSPGVIAQIKGQDVIRKNKNVISYFERYKEGDCIPESEDVRRRYAEICLLSDSRDEEIEAIEFIQNNLHVLNENSKEMICDMFSTDKL